MAEVAAAHGVPFVDLFAPTPGAVRVGEAPLTINGIHLNADGNRRIAEIIDATLFGGTPRVHSAAYLDALRQAVVDKNFHWFNRYRTTDGYSTYGDRAFLTFIRGNPRDVNPDRGEVRQGRRAADQLRGAASARWRCST